MSRKDEFKSENPNPATKFLNWKSNDKNFAYWCKEEEKEIHVEIPLTFLVLKDLSTVGGWHDASESGIYGNEVKSLFEEPIFARAYKANAPIAEGLYKDIKNTVNDAGGHYVKSLYVMLKDGSIVNVKLKGSAVKEWSDFTAKGRQRMSDEWVSVFNSEDRKKGSITYSVPLFQYDKSLSKKEASEADIAYDLVNDYFVSKVNSTPENDVNNIETEHENVSSDLDPDLEL